jgi:hypothetical protein
VESAGCRVALSDHVLLPPLRTRTARLGLHI